MKNKKEKSKNNFVGEELENVKNQLARVMADYANLQKRTDEERKMMFKLASVSFMNKILPILDNLKNAQNHIKDSGIAMIIGQLETLAKEEGFEEIKINLGDKFDENSMEVIEAIETDQEMDNNSVSEVILSGWKYSDGTVVRHSRVKVFRLNKTS